MIPLPLVTEIERYNRKLKEHNREKHVKENLNEIKKTYNSEKIIDEYEILLEGGRYRSFR